MTLTKTQFSKTLAGAVVALAIAGCTSTPVDAQSTLQPVAGQGIQQSANQNQTGGTDLNQTGGGGLQTNQAAPTLERVSNQSLGVVSSPSQTTPDAVVAPSSTLKTDLSDAESSSIWPWVAAISFVLAAGFFIWWLAIGRRATYDESSEEIVEDEEAWIDPADLPKKQRRTKKPKKKKSHRR